MKVGEYIRTKDGIIAKIISVKENPLGKKTIFELDREINIFDLEMGDMYLLCNPIAEETTNEIDTHFGDDKIIAKSSPNIIDLIELNDIVELFEEDGLDNDEITGYYEVIAITTNKKEIGVRTANGEIDFFPAENLRGIITYEQIKTMEYKCE